MNQANNESYCEPLIGHQLLSVEELDYSWFFVFGEDVSVVAESAWRLISDERIIVTSEDHGHQFGLPKAVDAADRVLSCVADRAIEGVTICASTGDPTIRFSDQIHLQFVQMSCGYESWKLSIHGGETICTGGGDIAHIPAI